MTDIKCSINWQRVEKEVLTRERIGPRKNNPAIFESVKTCIEKARLLCSPNAIFSEKKIISILPDSIDLEGNVTLLTRSISAYIKGGDRVRIFLVTIGCPLEEEASRLMNDGEQLEGYLLDRIGSFAVEMLAEDFEYKLREACALNKESVSMRFSPGYCDWPIEEQFKLDKLINFSKAGVRLTENCMMIPKKSISAMTGIGPEGAFSPNKRSPCFICNIKKCDYKRMV
jgi:hypothetical protein